MFRHEMPHVNVGRIEAYLYCPASYYLDTIVKESGLPMSGFFAKYYRQKEAIGGLYPEERFVGPDREHIESLTGNKLAQYLSHESPASFGKGVMLEWIETIINKKGKVHDRDVVWFPGQWVKAMSALNKSCENYYKFIMQEGPPILAYNDKDVAFEHQGVKYTVRFNSIRKGLVVCKYSSSDKTQKFLDEDFAVTMKLLAFCTLAHGEEAYRMVWGVGPRLARTWGGRERFIVPEVTYRYYNLSSGEILETRRSDADILAALQVIGDTQKKIKNGEFTPADRKKCTACKYNVKDRFERLVCLAKPKKVKCLRHFDIAPIYFSKGKARKKKELRNVKPEKKQLDLF